MPSLSLTISDKTKALLDQVIARGDYPTVEAYLSDLVDHDQGKLPVHPENVEALLLEAINDPSPRIVADDAFWEARILRSLERQRVGL